MSISLLDLEIRNNELIKEKAELTEKYEKEIKRISFEQEQILHNKNITMNNFNVDKIANAKKFIYTRGCKKNFEGDARESLQEVINDTMNEFKILKENYIGCKDYSGFWGQGITCGYNRCPTHGSVVMNIGLIKDYRYENASKITDEDKCDILYFLNLLKDKNNREKILMDKE